MTGRAVGYLGDDVRLGGILLGMDMKNVDARKFYKKFGFRGWRDAWSQVCRLEISLGAQIEAQEPMRTFSHGPSIRRTSTCEDPVWATLTQNKRKNMSGSVAFHVTASMVR